MKENEVSFTQRELKEEEYYAYSAKLSEINRNISFSGIAVIWLFKGINISENAIIQDDLIPPLLCFVLSLFFDFVHYLFGTVLYQVVLDKSEAKGQTS